MVDILYLAVVFLIVALIAYALGARGFAFFTAGIGRFLIWVFVVLFLVTLLLRFI